MSKDINELNDFEVYRASENESSTRGIFNRYCFFRETFDQLPKKELVDRGWIERPDDIFSMLPLLKDIQTGRNNALYRKANTANEALCSAWLSVVTEIAKIKYITEKIPPFDGIDKNFLKEIAHLSLDETIPLKLPDILKERGIILIYQKTLPAMKMDGVVFKLESGNPVIGLSFRFPRMDNFWFTLMHELSHIVLHFDQLERPIFDDLEENNDDLIELQANRLAKSSFVRNSDWRNCEPKYNKGDDVLIKFSESIGVHPAIIAGMLRREDNNYTMYSKIVNAIDVREMVFNEY